MRATIYVAIYCAIVLGFALPAERALAQYPIKPIRALVPIPPGGGPDVVGRMIGPKLSEARLPEIRDKLRATGGVETWITSPEEFASDIRTDHAKYAKLVKEAGIKVD